MQPTRNGLHFQQPKTHRSCRPVALPATLAALLTEHRHEQETRRTNLGEHWQSTDLVVDAGDGGPINPDTLTSMWRRFVREHQLPNLRFHDLRHSHAAVMLLAGIHPKVISERLGHASISFTLEVYTHLLPDMQNEAAEAMDRILRNAAA